MIKVMLKTFKKAVKWYFNKAAETYAWTPSCTIPINNNNENGIKDEK